MIIIASISMKCGSRHIFRQPIYLLVGLAVPEKFRLSEPNRNPKSPVNRTEPETENRKFRLSEPNRKPKTETRKVRLTEPETENRKFRLSEPNRKPKTETRKVRLTEPE